MATTLAVTETGLELCFTGLDRAAACRPRLHLPFERIVGSRVMSRSAAVASSPRLPCPGSWWPRRLRVGCWGVGERRQLWSVRRSADVVVVYLSGRPFHRVVVEVEDCRRTHRAIDAALLHSKTVSARESLRARLDQQVDAAVSAPSRRRH
jgi:hypothetical protein